MTAGSDHPKCSLELQQTTEPRLLCHASLLVTNLFTCSSSHEPQISIIAALGTQNQQEINLANKINANFNGRHQCHIVSQGDMPSLLPTQACCFVPLISMHAYEECALPQLRINPLVTTDMLFGVSPVQNFTCNDYNFTQIQGGPKRTDTKTQNMFTVFIYKVENHQVCQEGNWNPEEQADG